MRNLLVRFALWLCARLEINPVDETRIRNGTDAVARGVRWNDFYREEGGIKDFFINVRRGYFEAAAALGVSDTDKLYEYALADRIAREVEREVLTVIATGQVEADRIAANARNNIAAIRR
jgi:hypothetical protein